MRNGVRRARRLEESVLYRIECVVGIRDQTSGEAIEPAGMRVEQSGQALCLMRLQCAGDGPFAHILLNV